MNQLTSFDFTQFAIAAGTVLDAVGVVVILGGALVATLAVAVSAIRNKKEIHHFYRQYRQNLGRSILIGLEFLVAGDIIRSVGGNLSLDNVIILAIIVVIRSLLGIEFEMEIEGRWPWRRGKSRFDN